jgi:DedD protein
MTNERGGILSKILIIPAGVALMVGFFYLGYHVGKYQSKSEVTSEVAPPLPEMASSTVQKQEEFTFYKTLSSSKDNMVSIDLMPKPAKEEGRPGKQLDAPKTRETKPVQSATKKERIETKIEKEAPRPVKPKQPALKQPKPVAKKEPVVASQGKKLRYTVQTASYKEKEMAKEEVKRLKKRGYAAFITSIDLPGKGMWHRVRLGSFSQKSAAEKLKRKLQAKEGISPIVVVE